MDEGRMYITEPTTQYCTFEDLLQKDGYFIYTNVGYSMTPLLRQKRDIIEIHQRKTERSKKYDVVLYKRGDKYILHRILKVLPDGYLIAGDHCVTVERDVKDENILGVMTSVIRNGKVVTTDNIWYKLYVHIWCDVYPIRMLLIRTRWFVYRCLRFIKRKVFG